MVLSHQRTTDDLFDAGVGTDLAVEADTIADGFADLFT
jgi:hypothetical protein